MGLDMTSCCSRTCATQQHLACKSVLPSRWMATQSACGMAANGRSALLAPRLRTSRRSSAAHMQPRTWGNCRLPASHQLQWLELTSGKCSTACLFQKPRRSFKPAQRRLAMHMHKAAAASLPGGLVPIPPVMSATGQSETVVVSCSTSVTSLHCGRCSTAVPQRLHLACVAATIGWLLCFTVWLLVDDDNFKGSSGISYLQAWSSKCSHSEADVANITVTCKHGACYRVAPSHAVILVSLQELNAVLSEA